jgi:hypothetical protein
VVLFNFRIQTYQSILRCPSAGIGAAQSLSSRRVDTPTPQEAWDQVYSRMFEFRFIMYKKFAKDPGLERGRFSENANQAAIEEVHMPVIGSSIRGAKSTLVESLFFISIQPSLHYEKTSLQGGT